MAAPVLQIKRGLLANLPGLRAGEPGFTTDSHDLYVGIDSTTANNKFFGSHRYWTKNTTTTGSGVNFVEGTSNGTQYITLKAPDSLSGITTFILPSADGSSGQFLKTNGSGVLSFDTATLNIAGGTGTDTVALLTDTLTFAGTAKEVNTVVTDNQVQIGLTDDVEITNNFKVSGISTFVGAVTFEGGTITLGDAATDNVVFGADINSSILPNTDATFDVGIVTQRWRNTHFSGIGTFATGAVIDAIQIGITAASEIDTLSGNLTLDSAGGTVTIDDNATVSGTLGVTGTTTLSGTLELGNASDTTIARSAAGTITVEGVTVATETNSLTLTNKTINLSSNTLVATSAQLAAALTDETGSGSVVFSASPTFTGTLSAATVTTSGNVTIGGDLFINGSTTQVNTTSLTVEDTLIELGLVNASAPSSDLNVDLGIIFNYYTSSAKKAAVFWDDSVSRIVFADDVSESSSVLTVAADAYASIEVESIFINDCAGQSQLITCTGSTRNLENITIDGGSF